MVVPSCIGAFNDILSICIYQLFNLFVSFEMITLLSEMLAFSFKMLASSFAKFCESIIWFWIKFSCVVKLTLNSIFSISNRLLWNKTFKNKYNMIEMMKDNTLINLLVYII